MATFVIVAGRSSMGKSTAYCPVNKPYLKIKGLEPEKTFLFNIASKLIPVKGGQELYPEIPLILNEKRQYTITGKGRRLDGHDYAAIQTVVNVLKLSKTTEYIIVDDFQYLMSLDFFDRRNETGYDKYGKIGFSVIDLLSELVKLPDHMIVFILAHTDTEVNGESVVTKLKTIGKMLDEKFSLEGMFSIVLSAVKEFNKKEKKLEYKFLTCPQTVDDITKSPIGMFEDENEMPLNEIPNDMGIIAEAVKNFRKLTK